MKHESIFMKAPVTMRPLLLLWILIVIIFTTACAGLAGPEGVHKKADPIIPPDDTSPPAAEPAKVPSFTNEVLYDLLVAEFARQRDRFPLAASRYLDAAIASRDMGIAKQATRISLFAKDWERALAAVTLWLEIDPDTVDAKQIYAALSIRAGRIEETIPVLRSLVENPDIPAKRRFMLVGKLLGRGEDKETALLVMERVIAEHDDNPHALFAFAHFLIQIGKNERAISLLEQVIAMDGTNPSVWLYYAQFLRNQGKTTEALDTFSNALENGIEDEDVRVGFARLLIGEERYEEAREQFEQVIASKPDNAEIRYILALFLMQTGHENEARKHLRYLVDQDRFVHEAYFNLGQIAESREDTRTAMTLYRKVEDGQHYLDAQIRIADLLAKQKKISAARRHLHDISPETSEDSIRLYQMEGLILTDAGNFEEAMSIYDAALGEHPENIDLLYARAMLAGRMGLLPILERDLRQVLSQEPDNADALNALGYTLADQTDRHQEALVLIQRALALRSDSYYILDSMGWVLYRLGQHQKAIDYLQRALAIQQDAEVAAHLGEVLWVTGNRKAAREIWNKALKEAPDDKRLLETMERFDIKE
uniref:Tfp pilus assembly protein PilF n=1 Tax=Candidatus Kentrum sp. FW TaxID=2126338 RepID=A0A450S792_9GAMM|nr:MAG: Tfp pilus assembly protein PilF [Candidatus Kentron sp. FW]VFJ62987.1 MAG: Tfp pilus assembly protein PilF [Candidatus Kentron sp. FW]